MIRNRITRTFSIVSLVVSAALLTIHSIHLRLLEAGSTLEISGDSIDEVNVRYYAVIIFFLIVLNVAVFVGRPRLLNVVAISTIVMILSLYGLVYIQKQFFITRVSTDAFLICTLLLDGFNIVSMIAIVYEQLLSILHGIEMRRNGTG